MATAPTYEKGKLYQIPVTDLTPDPDQPRKVIDPEALAELVTSIEKYGIIQPLLFRDECRGDRTITRQTLIEIARKKQERRMITAYKAFRLKQLKTQESGEKVCAALIAVKNKIDIFISPNPVPA